MERLPLSPARYRPGACPPCPHPFTRPYADSFGCRAVVLRPESRGRLDLVSADPRQPMCIRQKRCNPRDKCARHCRVHYHPLAPIEAWHPRHRNRLPRPPRLRRGLPGGCALPPHRSGPDALRAITRGAVAAPYNSPPANLQHLPTDQIQQRYKRHRQTRLYPNARFTGHPLPAW